MHGRWKVVSISRYIRRRDDDRFWIFDNGFLIFKYNKYMRFFLILLVLIIGNVGYSQQLKQIQKGTANNQIPVTNGVQHTQVYRDALPYILDTLGIRDSIAVLSVSTHDSIYKKTELLPNIIGSDTVGFYHIVHIGNYSDTTLVNIKSCGSGPSGLNQTEIENLFNGGTAQGVSMPSENVGINTMDPEFTLDVNAVDGIRIPVGTTGERPINPKRGVIRFNTTRNRFEGYNGNRWVNFGL